MRGYIFWDDKIPTFYVNLSVWRDQTPQIKQTRPSPPYLFMSVLPIQPIRRKKIVRHVRRSNAGIKRSFQSNNKNDGNVFNICFIRN